MLVLASSTAAFLVRPPTFAAPAAPRRACALVACATPPVDVEESGPDPPKRAISWQEELETLLAPETPQDDREMMLKELLARAPEISDEVQAALQSRDLASLIPETSKTAALIDDLGAVQRQVVEDLLPNAATDVQSLLAETPALAQDVAERGPALLSLLQDPARAFNLVAQEARNAVTRTPEGLETPAYRVVREGDDYEVREYDALAVAATALPAGESELVAGSRGLTALTAYFFGGNADSQTLDMTTPVRIDVAGSAGGASRMSLKLPERLTGAVAPAPTGAGAAAVSLETLEVQTLALREFSGFATAAEVRRQRDALLRQLQREGVPLDDPSGVAHVVLQYNPPYTLPWLRRNEVGLALVTIEEAPDAETEAAQPDGESHESAAAAEPELIMKEEEDTSPSD